MKFYKTTCILCTTPVLTGQSYCDSHSRDIEQFCLMADDSNNTTELDYCALILYHGEFLNSLHKLDYNLIKHISKSIVGFLSIQSKS